MLEPLLPVAVLGRPSVGRRKLIDGIRWRVRTGAPRRDLPREYGPWQTVYGLFRRWQRDGTWSDLLTRLQARADAAGLITWEVNVDSTICHLSRQSANSTESASDGCCDFTERRWRRACLSTGVNHDASLDRFAVDPIVHHFQNTA
ncbi:hypothetical protein GCM10022384_42200 [Streptomyces marokkonensis]|uniref:Insertion element IS402-like domain-containing protein n=1 Tax=Streptomyces marokkonensis TaxID=324855 RepID=A0ABP7QY64_9ACTN